MRSRKPVEIRRARPLLGTLVEVRATAPTITKAEKSLAAAFKAIQRVHHLMSFHQTDSDVGQLNQSAARKTRQVHPWTYTVLRRALKLHTLTQGLFDIAVAPALVRDGWLPRRGRLSKTVSTSADIILSAGNRVRFRRPLLIDLGGIAKGFAVDRAIAALRRNGATGGTVNAGGDLRVFGTQPELVHVRLPESPGLLVPLLKLKNAAIATSAHYFSHRHLRGAFRAPIHDPRLREFSAKSCSVSVTADECWLADALCKVAWLGGSAALPVLEKFGARAKILDADAMNRLSGDFSHAA